MTLNGVLENLENNFILKQGSLLETLFTVYPNYKIPRKEKNIIIEGNEMTVPLALSLPAKKMMMRDNSLLLKIYKDISMGDILMVEAIDKNKVVCKNVSMLEEYRKEITLDKVEILKGNYRMILRMNKKMHELVEAKLNTSVLSDVES
jgi:hypothetical protein